MDTLSKQRQITEGVIWKQLLIFFFPILLGTFFQQMYNTVDTIIVGRLVGTEALAAGGAPSRAGRRVVDGRTGEDAERLAVRGREAEQRAER